MRKRSSSKIALLLVVFIITTIPAMTTVQAGAIADFFSITDDSSGYIVDNMADYFGIGKLSDFGTKTAEYFVKVGKGANVLKYNPARAAELASKGSRLFKLSNGLRAGGQFLNLLNTGVDTYKLVTETSKHETTIEKGIDKGLLLVDVGMGWYAVGAGAVALFTAPAWGAGLVAAAGATGTAFLVRKLGVGAARIIFNSETYRNTSRYVRRSYNNVVDLATGKKKLVFAPFMRPGMKEGLDIIEEELGFDLYPGLKREIPDPSTGIPVYKPNIYLYSDIDMTVKVNLYPADWITESDPIYTDKGWTAQIIDGSLNGTEDFLFYEAIVPDEGFQMEEGWVIDADNRNSDMTKILDDYGFSEVEKNDFLEYWTEKLDADTDYLFLPQETECIELLMPLVLSEEADKMYRIWFYIIPYANQEVNEPNDIEVIERSEFTVVEWGGMLASAK